jgi:hypothetical protein
MSGGSSQILGPLIERSKASLLIAAVQAGRIVGGVHGLRESGLQKPEDLEIGARILSSTIIDEAVPNDLVVMGVVLICVCRACMSDWRGRQAKRRRLPF